VESLRHRDLRLRPLRDQRAVGILAIHPRAKLAPERGGRRAVGVVFHERAGHIDAKAARAEIEPVRHDFLQLRAHRLRSRRIDRLLPRHLRIGLGKPVVERRLEMEKVGHVVGVARRPADHDLEVGRKPRPHAVRPDVPIGILVSLVALRLAKPRALVGRVPGHEVEHHADAAPLRLGEERAQVVVGAVARGDFVEIGHVVARVAERRFETRAQPQPGHAQLLQVGQLLDDAAQVADPVAVGIAKRLRVDLIEDGVFEPGGHGARMERRHWRWQLCRRSQRNPRTRRTNSVRASMWGLCPEPAIRSIRAPEKCPAIRAASSART